MTTEQILQEKIRQLYERINEDTGVLVKCQKKNSSLVEVVPYLEKRLYKKQKKVKALAKEVHFSRNIIDSQDRALERKTKELREIRKENANLTLIIFELQNPNNNQ